MQVSNNILLKWGPEIIFLLYKTGNFMLDATIRPYVTTAVCREMFITDTTRCSSQSFLNDHEASIQEKTAAYLTYYRIFLYLPAFVLGFYWGAWSDQAGRKLPVIISNIGGVFGVLFYLILGYFPEHTLLLFIGGTAAQGFLCSSNVIKMALTAYVVENTSSEDITRRLSVLYAMNILGQFFGSLVSGVLQDITNPQYALCAASFFHTVTVIMTVFCINDNEVKETKHMESPFKTALSGIQQTMATVTKKRPGRCKILLILLATCLQSMEYIGSIDIPVLYVQGKPLQWPDSWYSYYTATDQAAAVFGLLFIQPLVSERLQLSDIMFLIVCLPWGIIRSVWNAFSVYSWMMWVSALLAIWSGLSHTLLRSLLSKEAQVDELGKLLSFMENIDIISRLVASSMYFAIYTSSMFYFRGMAFMVQGLILVLLSMVALCIYTKP